MPDLVFWTKEYHLSNLNEILRVYYFEDAGFKSDFFQFHNFFDQDKLFRILVLFT